MSGSELWKGMREHWGSGEKVVSAHVRGGVGRKYLVCEGCLLCREKFLRL